MDGEHFVYEDNSLLPDHNDSLVWPWLNQQYDIPSPDEFLAIPRGPIVHEGFVPDDTSQASPLFYGFPEEPVYDVAEASDGNLADEVGSQVVDDAVEDPDFEDQGDHANQDDQMLSGDEAFEDDDAGPYARTRTRRRRGRPKGPRIYTTSRGRYGRNMGRGGRGIKRGPRLPPEPSQDFIALQTAATEAFIDESDFVKALDLIQRAISINPEVYTAHSLVAEIYFAQGEEAKAIAALMTGAHALPRDPSVWQQIADVCLQRISDKNREQALQSASYCFARLLQLDHDDHDSRFQRAAISRQLGNRGKALQDLERLLLELPNNPSVLRQMAEVYTDMQKPQRAKELYERSIAYHQSIDDRESFTFSDINVYAELFGFTEDYARGIAVLKSLSRWLLGRDEETFWDAVQEDDREWDAEDTPRRAEAEAFKPGVYPPESYGNGLPLELRVKLGLFRLKLGENHASEALKHFSWLENELEGPDTDLRDYADLYRDAAVGLQNAGLVKEAVNFYEPLAAAQIYLDARFLLAAGKCLLECGQIDESIHLFEQARVSDPSSVDARLQLSRVYNQKGMTAKSKAVAQEAISIGRQNLMRPERRRYERREQREQREQAERELKVAHNLTFEKLQRKSRGSNSNRILWRDGRSKRPIGSDAADEVPSRSEQRRPKRNNSKAATPQSKAAQIHSQYSALLEVQDEARGGDSEAQEAWLDIADELIRDFRSNRALFPSERSILFEGFDPESRRNALRKLRQKNTENEADRRDQGNVLATPSNGPSPSTMDIPTSYNNISFSAWLDIFLEYSLILARMGQQQKDRSYNTIEAATDCVVWFHSSQSMLLIHIVWFTCALALNDAETMNGLALRWFMKEYQFMTDVYGLFSALNLLHCPEPADLLTQARTADWRSGASQKFVFRQLKANDYYLPEDYNMSEKAVDVSGPVPSYMREEGKGTEDIKASLTYKDPDTGRVLPPQDMDIALLVLYGQILYAGNSFPNALNYFYRAYALNKKSPLVCLSIALAYIHQSLKRQSDNRHLLVMQGMAFFQEYADCRVHLASSNEREQALEEVEFNKARVWHLLGISNLAVQGYWKVLEGEHSLSKKSDAAVALQMIYALGGDTETARDITERWLVID